MIASCFHRGPLAETLDVFPFDLSAAGFLIVYPVLALVGLGLALAVRRLVLHLLQPRPPEGPRRLRVGVFPSEDDVLAIAYLRAGAHGVEEAILARALAEGWLERQADGRILVVHPLPPDACDTSHELAAAVQRRTTPEQVHHAARPIAARRVDRLEHTLALYGLLQPKGGTATSRTWMSAPRLASLAYWGVAALVIAIALLRAMRGEELGRPSLYVQLEATLVLVAFVFAPRTKRLTRTGRRYLQWLRDVTVSLRDDVRFGQTRGAFDLALAAAITGITAVPLAAMTWSSLVHANTSNALAASGSSCSVFSSCSSASSCGGGGGCGGGCGGCGGCGG